jgi:hypothetical protein
MVLNLREAFARSTARYCSDPKRIVHLDHDLSGRQDKMAYLSHPVPASVEDIAKLLTDMQSCRISKIAGLLGISMKHV